MIKVDVSQVKKKKTLKNNKISSSNRRNRICKSAEQEGACQF